MIARIDNWPERFNALFARHRRTAFAWGVHDCCQLARQNITALCGADPAADWKIPGYSTAEGAAAALDQLGGIEALPIRAGLKEIAIGFAGRGDLALDEIEGRPTLGVVAGRDTAFAGKEGLVFRPTRSCLRAWRVG